MATITLNGITGNSPYNITVCDGFGNNCVYFPNLSTPTPFILSLPSLYDSAPITMVTITDASGCTKMELFYCDDTYPEVLCFNLRYDDGTGGYIDYPISLSKDENINNIPSYVGSFSGDNITMYWDNTNWIIQPYGFTSIGPDLFYGIWGSIGSYTGSLSNEYCPSICVFTDDGIVQSTTELQLIIYTNYPPGVNLTTYQDTTSNYYIEWNSGTTNWDYYESSVLISTLSGDEDTTPIGSWVMEPGAPYNYVVTSIVCPTITLSSKQFQDNNYFFFMDSELYEFQN